MNYSKEQKANCVLWYSRKRSPMKVQRLFRAEYGRNESTPSINAREKVHTVFLKKGSVETPKKQRDKLNPKLLPMSLIETLSSH